MDYEQKYKEVLERAKGHYGVAVHYGKEEEIQELEHIFPELKEIGEDKKMKEMAIKAVHSPEAQSCLKSWGVNPDDVISWLERQGDKAFSVERVFAEAGIKPAYKDGNSWCVLIGENIQEGICGFGETPRDAYIAFLKKLWGKAFEQNPADKIEPKFRVGDTIRPKGSSAKIFKITGISISDGYYKGEGSYLDIIAADDDYELVEQKPAWSEKDEKMLASFLHKLEVCTLLTNKEYQWANKKLKSLKEMVQPKQEWSEEDEKRYTLACVFIRNIDEVKADLIAWFKSLKERCTWKPSDEQMEALDRAQAELCSTEYNKPICDLIDALKKLKG